MKFIFPKNFNFKNKLFGVIDYSTIFMDSIWLGFLFLFANLMFHRIMAKLFFMILLGLPFILMSISGLNGENFLYVFRYMLSFAVKQKLYLYFKKSN